MENNLDEKTEAWVVKLQQKLTEIHYETLLNPYMTCVYALEMDNQTVKIGKTRNFENRMRTISSSSGLEVVNCYHTEYVHHDVATKIEKACHETFDTFRTKGEFFKITFEEACAELVKYAEDIKEINRKFFEETKPAIQKKYDEYLESIRKNETAPSEEKSTTKRKSPKVLIETTKKAIIDAGGLMQIFEQEFSIPQDMARLKAVSIMELAYGIDLQELKKPIPPVEKEEEIWLTPKQLGVLVGKSAQYVNQRLVELGLQRKDFKYGYVVTDYGKELVECNYDDSNGHKRCQIKWFCCLKYLI